MLASSVDGDAFVWGCGLTHQLANLPRDVSNPVDIDDEPADELRPYRISSKQLEKRFVMVADGGAQHTVELAWDTSYSKLEAVDTAPPASAENQQGDVPMSVEGEGSDDVVEPPAKRRLTDSSESKEADTAHSAETLGLPADLTAEGFPTGFGSLATDDGKWKCEGCFLKWDSSVIKCKSCESYQPGLSEEAIAKMKAEEEARQAETVAKFQTATSAKPTGFSFGGESSGDTFGASTAQPVFGFSPGDAAASTGFQPSSFGFSAGSSGFTAGTTSFGFAPKVQDVGTMPFGFGGSTSSSVAPVFGFGDIGVPVSASSFQTKELDELPDFETADEVPVGDVFVHGSGECDQLGLGDEMRERRKPTLLKALVGKHICEIAVGAMHVLCVSADGGLFSWGCNDDGALGRVSSDGSDGGPSDVEPHQVSMPSGVAVRKVSCGDCHSCALDDRGRVWLWGTYKDSNGYIGIVHKRKQESEVVEKSADPALVLEGCSAIASGANHTVALVDAVGVRKVMAWGSNATGQLGLLDNVGCGFAERILSGSDLDELTSREGGGCEVAGEAVVRLLDANGTERSADKMTVTELQQAVSQGASVVVQVPDREVPKPEKKKLLHPQEMCLGTSDIEASNVEGAFASAECTFITTKDGTVFGCGLNGDGQVGLGFASMAVQTLRAIRRVRHASWLGGCLHSSAALADGRVFTWGKAEECGLGLGEKDSV